MQGQRGFEGMKNPQALLDALGPVMLNEEHQALTKLLGGKNMKDNQTQLFKTDYETRCDTFGCEENGEYFVGRPDGPLNTSHLLCESCTESLVESVKELFPTNDVSADALEYEVEEVLENIKTHAQLDELIAEFKIKGIPDRNEEGGKLSERKDSVRAAFK